MSLLKIRLGAVFAAAAVLLLISAGNMFPQDVGKAELHVPPPSYAKFDSTLSKAFEDYLAMPITQKGYQQMAEQMGFSIQMRIVVYVCDRSVEEVAGYYASKTEQEAEFENEPLISDPSELEEMERETKESFPAGFLDRYRAAYNKYQDQEISKCQFDLNQINYQTGGTAVTVEIGNPGLNIATFQPVNKTTIQYTLIEFKKK
jgi:hypothetical protein